MIDDVPDRERCNVVMPAEWMKLLKELSFKEDRNVPQLIRDAIRQTYCLPTIRKDAPRVVVLPNEGTLQAAAKAITIHGRKLVFHITLTGLQNLCETVDLLELKDFSASHELMGIPFVIVKG